MSRFACELGGCKRVYVLDIGRSPIPGAILLSVGLVGKRPFLSHAEDYQTQSHKTVDLLETLGFGRSDGIHNPSARQEASE